MRVILFNDWFADMVRDGRKRQTIRQVARFQIGDALSLRRWTGAPYRSKQEVLLETVCTGLWSVHIHPDRALIDNCFASRTALALSDGFLSYAEMLLWFDKTHGLPFNGVIIGWNAEVKA
jgi:hypothetical protein